MSVKFLSPRDVRQVAGAAVPWIWDGYVARGAVTILASAPKIGKSMLMFGLASMMQTGGQLLARKVERAGVLYFSEEHVQTIREKADRFDIANDGACRFLSQRDMVQDALVTALEASVAEASAIGAGMLVIDTLAAWGGLRGDSENHAGACEDLMTLLRYHATASNLAVVLVHHCTKSSKNDVIRGSTALTGAADILVTMSEDEVVNGWRILNVRSRFNGVPKQCKFGLSGRNFLLINE